MVEAGLTPLEAIAVATNGSAKAVGLEADRGTIAQGKLADFILVRGQPEQDIADLEKLEHVFLAGREMDLSKLARTIAAPDRSPLPAIRSASVIDDFETDDGLSRLHTRWVNSTDPGHDHSKMVFARVPREGKGQALSVLANFSEKDLPFVRVSVPLRQGGVLPADLSEFHGVRFEARSSGKCRLIAITRGGPNGGAFQASFGTTAKWKAVKLPFESLRNENGKGEWKGNDVLLLSFELARPAGTQGWLELDNLSFYK